VDTKRLSTCPHRVALQALNFLHTNQERSDKKGVTSAGRRHQWSAKLEICSKLSGSNRLDQSEKRAPGDTWILRVLPTKYTKINCRLYICTRHYGTALQGRHRGSYLFRIIHFSNAPRSNLPVCYVFTFNFLSFCFISCGQTKFPKSCCNEGGEKYKTIFRFIVSGGQVTF
jgi:hypothetical protein